MFTSHQKKTTEAVLSNKNAGQEAQLSQRGREMLRVTDYFGTSLKVIEMLQFVSLGIRFPVHIP